MNPGDGYEALRRFRVSLPHTDYFLTMGTAVRKPGLTLPAIAETVRDEILSGELNGDWTLRGAVIMPDHLHLLATLHNQLSLDRIIARFKAKTRLALASSGLRWQPNYYEHRLRNTDAIEPVLLYIFLNPYRANLLRPRDTYPWFWMGAQDATWFKPRLDDGKPFVDWLR
jgi:REP element-mobilizing transposase RayT